MSNAKITGVDAQVGDRSYETRADFHMFELHGTTAWGVGITLLVLVGVGLFIWYRVRKAVQKKVRRMQLPTTQQWTPSVYPAITYQHPGWHGQPAVAGHATPQPMQPGITTYQGATAPNPGSTMAPAPTAGPSNAPTSCGAVAFGNGSQGP